MTHNSSLELLIATGNAGKIREIAEALQGLPIRLRYLREFHGVSAADEVGTTYEENAIIKAMSYANQVGICALADDSGLEVDALGRLPGVRSARYGGEDLSEYERTQKLLVALSPNLEDARTARFVCCMALVGRPSGPSLSHSEDPRVVHICEAKCDGRITEEPRGTNGFGYDPVFVPIGYEQTFGELSTTIKNVISHRAKALVAMRTFLNGWIA